MGKIVIGLVLSIVVARILGLPLIFGIAIVGGLWMMQGTTGAAGLGGAVSSVGRGISSFFRGIGKTGLFVLIFGALVLVVFAATSIQPAGWPALRAGFILAVSVLALTAGIAARTATGNWRVAGWVFGLAALGIFGAMKLPTTRATVAPASWKGADSLLNKVVSEVPQRGAISVAGMGATTLLVGKPANTAQHGAIGSSARRMWRWAFGEGSPKPAAAQSPRANVPPSATMAPPATFETTGDCIVAADSPLCKLKVEAGGKIRTGGRPVHILFQGRKEWYFFSGSGPIPSSVFATGLAQFAPVDDGEPVHVKILRRVQ